MNDDSPGHSNLRTIFTIGVAGFLLWLVALLALWWILNSVFQAAVDFWTMTGALSTAAAVTAIFVAGYVAIDWLVFHGHVTSWFLGWL